MMADGVPGTDIARVLGVPVRTVQAEFKTQGAGGLVRDLHARGDLHALHQRPELTRPDTMAANNDAALAMAGLVDYCERCASGFRAALQPVPDEELERLLASTGLPIPPEYRAYLQAFGRAEAAQLLPFMDDVDYGCQAVATFYADPPAPVPPDAVYLWTAGGDSEMFLGAAGEWQAVHPVLSFSYPVDETTGRFLPHDRGPFVVAQTLFTFLYREAYARLRRPRLAHHRVLRENAATGARRGEGAAAQRAQRFLEVVHPLGFQSLPHLDPLTPICERPDAVVSLFGEVEAEDTLFVDANDEREANRIAEILADNLGARAFG